MQRFLLGVASVLIAIVLATVIYLHFGNLPVALADRAFPFEKRLVEKPLDARIDREYPRKPGLEATEANLQMGAHVYRQQCAACQLFAGDRFLRQKLAPGKAMLTAKHAKGNRTGEDSEVLLNRIKSAHQSAQVPCNLVPRSLGRRTVRAAQVPRRAGDDRPDWGIDRSDIRNTLRSIRGGWQQNLQQSLFPQLAMRFRA